MWTERFQTLIGAAMLAGLLAGCGTEPNSSPGEFSASPVDEGEAIGVDLSPAPSASATADVPFYVEECHLTEGMDIEALLGAPVEDVSVWTSGETGCELMGGGSRVIVANTDRSGDRQADFNFYASRGTELDVLEPHRAILNEDQTTIRVLLSATTEVRVDVERGDESVVDQQALIDAVTLLIPSEVD